MTQVRQHPMVAGTTTTEGLSAYVVGGSFPPYRPFSAIPNNHLIRYVATDGTQFEEGYGTKTSGPTLSRSTILRTSNGDDEKIDWGTGTRVVYPVPDLDTAFEIDDGVFMRFLRALQIESEGRAFRIETTNGIFRLVDVSEAPSITYFRYNPTGATKSVSSDVEFGAPAMRLAGTLLGSAATRSVGNGAGQLPILDSQGEFARDRLKVMGAASASAGLRGAVPAPPAGSQDAFLAGDATFKRPRPIVHEAWRTSWNLNQVYSHDHALGGVPDEAWLEVRAKDTHIGHTAGQIQEIKSYWAQSDGGTQRGCMVLKDATTVYYKIAAGGMSIHGPSGIGNVTDTNYDLRVVAKRYVLDTVS